MWGVVYNPKMTYMWVVYDLRDPYKCCDPWRMVYSISILLLLGVYDDQYVHTHNSCIPISVICSWCQLKGWFLYARLSMIVHVKYMTNKIWSCVVYKGVYVLKAFSYMYIYTQLNVWRNHVYNDLVN